MSRCTLARFLAAFPANLAFPVFVVIIVRYGLDANIWLSPLMILGTQWYILFNVIAGASAFPSDLKEAAASLHRKGWRWWTEVILPGIFPYYITAGSSRSRCRVAGERERIAIDGAGRNGSAVSRYELEIG